MSTRARHRPVMTNPVLPLRTFAVWCDKDDAKHEAIVLAPTANAARYRKWCDIREVWDDVPYTSMHARVVRDYVEPSGFRHVCTYRGVEFARVNMRVRLSDGREGRITGASDGGGALLSALFDGVDLSFHPNNEVAYLADDGSVIAKYGA